MTAISAVGASPRRAEDWWRPEAPAAATARGQVQAAPPDAGTSGVAYTAFVAFTFALLLAPQNLFPFLGSLRIVLLMGTLAIVAHVRDRWELGLPLARPSRETRVAAALLVWALVGWPFSLWPGGTLALFLDMYLKALIVFWLMSNLVDTLPRLRGMAWSLTWIAVTLALVGISNYLTGVFAEGQDRRIVGYDGGLTRNPNDLALMLNLIIPIAVSLLLSTTGAFVRTVLVAALALQVAAVVLTFSRAGFLTLVITLGLYGLRVLRRPGRGFVLAGLAVAVLSLPFLPTGYAERLLTLRSIDADRTGSAQARWEGTVAAIENMASHPLLGAGLGMDILALNETVGPTWRAVHNTYLEYGVDLGLPGFVLFLLLLWSSWKSARAARRLGGRDLASLAEGIEISLVAFAFAALFHPAAYQFYFYYIAGLAVAVRTVASREAAAP
jgi:O-antigen ligase/polysaccharide polymerase Wzy-like membrane protein